MAFSWFYIPINVLFFTAAGSGIIYQILMHLLAAWYFFLRYERQIYLDYHLRWSLLKNFMEGP